VSDGDGLTVVDHADLPSAFPAIVVDPGLDIVESSQRDPRVSFEPSKGGAPLTVGRRRVAAPTRPGQQPPQKIQGAAATEEVLAGIRSRSRISTPIRKAAADADITDFQMHDHRNRALIAIGMWPR
jgi:hypothetical protein